MLKKANVVATCVCQEFKLKTHLARHLATAHGLSIQPGSPRPVMVTRAAFCLVTTALTRISRKVCKDILRPRHAARCCFIPINTAAIKQECEQFVLLWSFWFDSQADLNCLERADFLGDLYYFSLSSNAEEDEEEALVEITKGWQNLSFQGRCPVNERVSQVPLCFKTAWLLGHIRQWGK